MLNCQHYYSELSTNSHIFRSMTFRRCVNDIMIHAVKIYYKCRKPKFIKNVVKFG